MRTVRFLLTAAIFCTIFIGMVLACAVVTGAVHAQLSGRAQPMIVALN